MKKYTFALTQTTNELNENIVNVVNLENNTGYTFQFTVTNTPNIVLSTINNDAIFGNVFIEDGRRTLNGLFGYDFFQEDGENTYLVLDTFLNNSDTTTTRRMDVLNKEVFTIYFPDLETPTNGQTTNTMEAKDLVLSRPATEDEIDVIQQAIDILATQGLELIGTRPKDR